jgi:hypothetical protein
MCLSPAQLMTIASAGFGVAGTLFLFFGSYAYETGPLNTTFGEAFLAEKARIDGRNRRRMIRQRIGLGLLMASFALVGGSAFVPQQWPPGHIMLSLPQCR